MLGPLGEEADGVEAFELKPRQDEGVNGRRLPVTQLDKRPDGPMGSPHRAEEVTERVPLVLPAKELGLSVGGQRSRPSAGESWSWSGGGGCAFE